MNTKEVVLNKVRLVYVPKWDYVTLMDNKKFIDEDCIIGEDYETLLQATKWVRKHCPKANVYAQIQYYNYIGEFIHDKENRDKGRKEKLFSWINLFEEKITYDQNNKVWLQPSNSFVELFNKIVQMPFALAGSALETLKANFKLKLSPEELVAYHTKEYLTLRLTKKEAMELGVEEFPKDIPFPEIVHLEISNRCDKKCKYCYVHKKNGKEIGTEDWEVVIKKLATFGVFQITFGGGEPFMRDDIIGLAEFSKRLGLNVCVTSNGYFMKKPNITVEDLEVFDQVNVSYHGNKKEFKDAYDYLYRYQIRRGVNFVLSTDYEKDLHWVAGVVKKYGGELLLLTYKPTLKDIKKQIPPEKVLETAKQISAQYQMSVGVDGLTCGTCMATKRFVDVDSEGNMTPCSFIRTPIGNLIEEHIRTIWDRRPDDIKCPYLVKENKNGKLCKVCKK